MRIDHRRADVLVRGLSQRDGQLRRERLHRRSPGRASRSTAPSVCTIAYDRDEAGEKAAAELAEELMAMGIECLRVLFPQGMDANEYALKCSPRRDAWAAAQQAHWLGKGQPPRNDAEKVIVVPEAVGAACGTRTGG